MSIKEKIEWVAAYTMVYALALGLLPTLFFIGELLGGI
jgi:hypothetical protein